MGRDREADVQRARRELVFMPWAVICGRHRDQAGSMESVIPTCDARASKAIEVPEI